MVTNDGNAILRELDIAHPAAKVCGMFVFSLSWLRLTWLELLLICNICHEVNETMFNLTLPFQSVQSMIELSRTQDEEVGDGTTSVIVLGMMFFVMHSFLVITLLLMNIKVIIYLWPSFIIFRSMSSEVNKLCYNCQFCLWSN